MSDDKRIQFRTTRNPDGSPLRDKDNAKPIHKPAHGRHPPVLAPNGSVGIRPERPTLRAPETVVEQPVDRTMFKDDTHEVIDGRLLSMPGYHFVARLKEAPSQDGLGGGAIAQLSVMKDGNHVAVYNRGWEKDPETPEQREALHRIVKRLDDRPERDFEGLAKSPDKSRSIDR